MQFSTQKRILDDVMPLRIIREVEKWPVIYAKDNPEMINPHFKYKVWEKVAKNLFDNYQIFSAAEKQAKVTNLMKKWRNLRDTFKRQLMVEKRIREGHNIKKKQYVYFKHMSFLLPHMEDDGPAEAPAPLRASRAASRPRHHRAAPAPPPLVAPDLEPIDEDKHFLLSLLPSLQRMSEDEKLTAKMEILKVIKQVKNSCMSIDTLVADDSLAFADEHVSETDDEVVVKKELLTVELMDYKSPGDSNSGGE